MAAVQRGLEPNHVRAEEPAEQPLAPREHAEHLRAREGRVQEEPNPRAGRAPAEHLRREHEVVVVHPEHVARPVMIGCGRGEALVGRLVGVEEPVVVQPGHVEEMVEQRPERTVREPLVVPAHLRRVEVDGHDAQIREARRHAAPQRLRDRRGHAGPADPEGVAPLVQRAERRREPAGGRHDHNIVADGAERDREAVGQDEQSPHLAILSGAGHACEEVGLDLIDLLAGRRAPARAPPSAEAGDARRCVTRASRAARARPSRACCTRR